METWGTVPKSQTDPNTIDEEIDDKIQDHLDDPDAHIEAGQSLQSHKASEIIDHIASSIVADKIKDFEVYVEKLTSNKLHFWPALESLDAWYYPTGDYFSTLLYLGSVKISVLDYDAETTYLTSYYALSVINFGTKNPIFETLLSFSHNTSQTAYFGAGDPATDFFGFKVSNGTLYACVVINSNEYTTEISGITITSLHTYRAVQTSATNILFYVDGVLKHTESTHVNRSLNQDVVFYYKLTTTSANTRSIVIADCRYIQDN